MSKKLIRCVTLLQKWSRRQKCFQKCQICSCELDVSGLALHQYVDVTTPCKKMYAYAGAESARVKYKVNKLENHCFCTSKGNAR